MSETEQSFTLLEISRRTGISLNSLRYHLKKVLPLFSNIKRDRFNRFRFVSNDIETLQDVHRLKQSGLTYAEIIVRLGASGSLQHLPRPEVDATQISQTQFEASALKTAIGKLEARMADLESESEKIVQAQNKKIESLEERVALLVDLQVKSISD